MKNKRHEEVQQPPSYGMFVTKSLSSRLLIFYRHIFTLCVGNVCILMDWRFGQTLICVVFLKIVAKLILENENCLFYSHKVQYCGSNALSIIGP